MSQTRCSLLHSVCCFGTICTIHLIEGSGRCGRRCEPQDEDVRWHRLTYWPSSSRETATSYMFCGQPKRCRACMGRSFRGKDFAATTTGFLAPIYSCFITSSVLKDTSEASVRECKARSRLCEYVQCNLRQPSVTTKDNRVNVDPRS